FNFSRIRLLFIRYFTENWRRDITTFSAFFIAFAVLPRLVNLPLPIFPFILFCLIFYIGGLHFSARIFQEIHRPSSGMHYLHIPAGRAEKFFVNGALTLILYPLVCFFLFYAAILFGNLLEPIMPAILNYKTIDIHNLFPKTFLGTSSSSVGKLLTDFITYQSIFFFGSLIFKKHPTTKTIISLIACSIALGIYQLLLALLLWNQIDIASMGALKEKMLQLGEHLLSSRVMAHFDVILSGIIALFFWTVSYLKFKEKQV
ncbi:MAG: hypothetical protein FWE99_06950, partial [Bacteroidales bacterium]|nr:hypothetical protein [Bacteroidales bacterium]